MNMSFKAYMENVEAKSGKSHDELYRIASDKGFIADDKIIATHKQLLEWLKSDIGLGHVHANFVIAYLRLRTRDPKISEIMKTWAYSTGYKYGE
jgi:hypothetical protein